VPGKDVPDSGEQRQGRCIDRLAMGGRARRLAGKSGGTPDIGLAGAYAREALAQADARVG
jgi:hypothetical protein